MRPAWLVSSVSSVRRSAPGDSSDSKYQCYPSRISVADRTVFLDESGAFGFSAKSDRYYVVAAVFLRDEDLPAAHDTINRIKGARKELKSSKLKPEERRRVLAGAASIPFVSYFLVVDKAEVRSAGIKSSKSVFHKYLNALLLKYLDLSSNSDLAYRLDEHGRHTHMESFVKYMKQQLGGNPETPIDVGFVSSESEPCVQLADVLAGTMAKCIKGEEGGYAEMLSGLGGKVLGVKHWPRDSTRIYTDPTLIPGEYDDLIRATAFNIAVRYIDDNIDSADSVVRDRVRFLRVLQVHAESSRGASYMSSTQILENLNLVSISHVSRIALRNQIVGPLRDEGVIVVSTAFGYKMPTTMSEIYQFVEFFAGYIRPMLQRVSRLRERLRIASNGEFDVLDLDRYRDLQMALDEVSRDAKSAVRESLLGPIDTIE